MDKTVLSDTYKNDGRSLIDALAKEHFKIDAAMWFYSKESEEWRLLIATPLVGRLGPKNTYKRIQSVLAKLEKLGISISLRDITVLRPIDPLINTIMDSVRYQKETIIKDTVLNSVQMDDAYIYFIA